jgi:Ca2+-binding EF-hand superfamily protein
MRKRNLLALSLVLGIGLSAVALAQQPEPRGGGLFDRLDQNKDGAVGADEIPAERKAFFERLLREGDKNGDGRLSREEFQAAAQQPRGQRERDDGEKSAEQRPAQAAPNFDAAALFRNLDKNGDGKLTADEVPEERRERFQAGLPRTDKDGDGGLNLEEFRSTMMAMARLRGDANSPSASDAPPRPTPGNSPLFRAIDSDRDGKLSAEELAKAGEALKRLDRNGDGSLTIEELGPPDPGAASGRGQAGRPGANQPQQADDWTAAFLQRLKQADANGDGKLNKDEAPERMKENFERIDANGDGQIDEEELRRMMARFRQNEQANPPNRPRNRQPNGDR